MNAQIALQLLLRLLPSLLFFVTAYFAGRDERVRERWTEILYRTGSISVEQREDPVLQNKVRWPFLALGVLFLLWPIWYYWRDSYAQMPVQAVAFPTPVPTATPKPSAIVSLTPAPTPFGTPPALPNFSSSGSSPASAPNREPVQVPANNQPIAAPTPVTIR